MGFPRQEYWSGLPFPSPEDLPDPRIKPTSPALAGGFFTTEPPGNLNCVISGFLTVLWHQKWDPNKTFNNSEASEQPPAGPHRTQGVSAFSPNTALFVCWTRQLYHAYLYSVCSSFLVSPLPVCEGRKPVIPWNLGSSRITERLMDCFRLSKGRDRFYLV